MSRKKRTKKKQASSFRERTLEENQEIFRQLVLPMKEEVYALVQKNIQNEQDAEDVYQEIFASCWEALLRLKNIRILRNWAFLIAIRTISKYHRSQLKDPEVSFSELEDEPPPKYYEILINDQDNGDFVKMLLEEDQMDLVWRAFEELDENYRGIIWLWYAHDWSLKQVAGELEMNYNTVRVMFQRGMRKLREQYQRIQEEGQANEEG